MWRHIHAIVAADVTVWRTNKICSAWNFWDPVSSSRVLSAIRDQKSCASRVRKRPLFLYRTAFVREARPVCKGFLVEAVVTLVLAPETSRTPEIEFLRDGSEAVEVPVVVVVVVVVAARVGPLGERGPIGVLDIGEACRGGDTQWLFPAPPSVGSKDIPVLLVCGIAGARGNTETRVSKEKTSL